MPRRLLWMAGRARAKFRARHFRSSFRESDPAADPRISSPFQGEEEYNQATA